MPHVDAREDTETHDPSRLPVLRTRTPARTWEEGLVVGSGTVGAIVSGPADHQRLCLSHERFFLPANPRPAAPVLAPVLAGMRQALEEADPARANRLMEEAAHRSGYDDALVWTDPLGICATLTVAVPGGVADTVRTIDPEHGEVAVEWTDAGGGRHLLRALSPRGGETVWIELESDSGVVADLVVGLDPGATEPAETWAPDYSRSLHVDVTAGREAVVHATATHGEAHATTTVRGPVEWAAGADGGSATGRLVVPAAGRQTLRVDLRIGDGAAPDDPAPAAEWTALRAAQAATHGALVRRSILDLHGTGPDPDATTEEIWDAARSGDTDARRRVIEIAYLSGRAHIIAATGELPGTLQGVWQGTFTPAWSADYTMNGNVQNGTAAGLIPTGTPELARSVLRLVLPHLDDYRENARHLFGAEGMLLPSRMSTHGKANHFAAAYPHVFWVGCGGWVLRLAADLVAATGDRDVVDDALWELVEGVLSFAETAFESPDGVLRLSPGYSPENAPGGGAHPVATDATIDVAVYRDAARAARVLASARGDHTLDDRWDALVARLPRYRVAADGTLAEWIAPQWPEHLAHRHVSQLYPLWYDVDPAFAGDGAEAVDLRAAASATIAAKIAWRAEDPTAPPGRMEMAFGLVQLGLAAAALGDADAALTCAEWLAVEHWRPALTTTHDAGSIFNLDASGGLPAVVAAMLVGSSSDRLIILPALPAQWPAGAITGLRTRAGVVVDRLAWDPRGCTLTLRLPEEARWLRPDGRVELASPRPFRIEGRADADRTVEVSGTARTYRLDWTAPA